MLRFLFGIAAGIVLALMLSDDLGKAPDTGVTRWMADKQRRTSAVLTESGHILAETSKELGAASVMGQVMLRASIKRLQVAWAHPDTVEEIAKEEV